MERRIKDRYSASILREAMNRYGINQGEIKLLDGFESYMYEFTRNGNGYILRIGHSLRRNAELISGEVDWINYLDRGGASVSRAVNSVGGRLVESIEDLHGDCFLATAFEKAPGGPPRKEHWNSELYQRYGKLIGRMHALSKEYEPSNSTWKRPDWDSPIIGEIDAWLPPSEAAVLEKHHRLYDDLRSLPQDGETYGLIHQDAHAGNFFVDHEGCITLFDFDDCCYSWYMNDIAIVLFYAVIGQEDPVSFIHSFMKPFLQGYSTENLVDISWFEQIPHFLKMREIDLYAVIHRSFDVENITDPWVSSYMEGRRDRIMADVPFVNFDWDLLARYCS